MKLQYKCIISSPEITTHLQVLVYQLFLLLFIAKGDRQRQHCIQITNAGALIESLCNSKSSYSVTSTCGKV